MTDQQRWGALHASGANPVIHTHNLDRLVGEGCYFSQSVSPCPVSGPARTAMLTGHFIEKTGVRTNMDCNDSFQCPYPFYDELLAQKEYEVWYYGKFHFPESFAKIYTNPSERGHSVPELISKWEELYRLYLGDRTGRSVLRPEQLYVIVSIGKYLIRQLRWTAAMKS